MKNKLLICLSVLWVSCSNVVLSEYVSVQDGWKQNQVVQFRFTPADTLTPYNLYMGLRNDDTYPYSNIFLITRLVAPSGRVIQDTLEYEMASPNGEWLGKGTFVKSSKLFYRENFRFPEAGNYIFLVEQANRHIGKNTGVEVLAGITEIGFEVEKNSSH